MNFLDKLIEVNSIILSLFGIGIVGFLIKLYKLVQDSKHKKLAKQQMTDSRLDNLEKAQMATLHNKIYKQCQEHIERGWISLDDFDDLTYLFDAYKALGGNGTGEKIFNKVANLPNKEEKQ